MAGRRQVEDFANPDLTHEDFCLGEEYFTKVQKGPLEPMLGEAPPQIEKAFAIQRPRPADFAPAL